MPQREHARFCSADCRVAWNREHRNDREAEESALGWSAVAMEDVTRRLLAATAAGRPQGYVMISESVWWVTIVDATLVRYHPDVYDAVLARLPAAERELTEGTLAGLRFVRNQMGFYADHADFLRPPAARAAGPVAAWRWCRIPEPDLAWLSPLRRDWELERHRAYQAHLAGRTTGETFGRAAEFLRVAAAQSVLASA